VERGVRFVQVNAGGWDHHGDLATALRGRAGDVDTPAAALIKEAAGVDAELREGARGEFTVWVGEDQVAAKDRMGFPSETDILAAVQSALARG